MRSKLAKLAVACVVAGSFFCHGLARAQSAEGHSDWPGAGQLFVGTNYQPFDVEGNPPSITLNKFGKGRAIYVATPAQPQIMGPLYRQLYASLGIEPGPKTPDDVYARAVEGRVLYVNTASESKDVAIDGTMTGVLSGKRWTGKLRLESFGVDLLER